MTERPPVAIIMGSRSDWPTLKGAAEALEALGVPYEAKCIANALEIGLPTHGRIVAPRRVQGELSSEWTSGVLTQSAVASAV